MIRDEAKTEIHKIAVCFPKFKPESWRAIVDVYWEHLQGFPASALRGARLMIVEDPNRGKWGTAADKASDFPTAAELFDLCRTYIREHPEQQEHRGAVPKNLSIVTMPGALNYCYAEDYEYARSNVECACKRCRPALYCHVDGCTYPKQPKTDTCWNHVRGVVVKKPTEPKPIKAKTFEDALAEVASGKKMP